MNMFATTTNTTATYRDAVIRVRAYHDKLIAERPADISEDAERREFHEFEGMLKALQVVFAPDADEMDVFFDIIRDYVPLS